MQAGAGEDEDGQAPSEDAEEGQASVFGNVGIPDTIKAALKHLNIATPTPIQAEAIPVALQGRDLIGVAETGSGKTLAYLIPTITRILRSSRTGEPGLPAALILAPTRELAIQIDQHIAAFVRHISPGVAHVCIYGGVPKSSQVSALRAGVDVIVGTPGRVMDLEASRALSLQRVGIAVIDEADRMLTMGFEAQVRAIVAQVSANCQSLLWSATWPAEVDKLAVDLLNDPVRVIVGGAGRKANSQVLQHFLFPQRESGKYEALVAMLGELFDGGRLLCFVGTKRGCDALTKQLRLDGWPALGIHGDKDQLERAWVLEEFRKGENPIMVATDVAARGLDIKDIKIVVNFDLPAHVEDYIQRIGRTGRAGNAGMAVSILCEPDAAFAEQLIYSFVESRQQVPTQLLQFAAACSKEKA